MATRKSSTPAPADNKRRDKALAIATEEAQATHAGGANTSATGEVTINTSKTEDGKTTTDGATAAVTLRTTHSETEAPAKS